MAVDLYVRGCRALSLNGNGQTFGYSVSPAPLRRSLRANYSLPVLQPSWNCAPGSGHSTTLLQRQGNLPLVTARRRHQCVVAAAETSSAESSAVVVSNLTKDIFDRLDASKAEAVEAGGAGGRTTYGAFQMADAAWEGLRNTPVGAAAGPAPQFVQERSSPLSGTLDHDVVVCGGTLGVFVAAALAQKGWRTAVMERGPLRGRDQDWNISRNELLELVDAGLFTRDEVESCISIEFNPVRVGFYQGPEIWTEDVLNLGVSPMKLVDLARRKLEEAGGKVYEYTALEGVTVHPDGVLLTIAPPLPSSTTPSSNPATPGTAPTGPTPSDPPASSLQPPISQSSVAVTTGLLLDSTGHASPIVRQLRWGTKPDGVCLVVGGMASGPWPDNQTADIIRTVGNMQPQGLETSNLQYFWEAFPSSSGPDDRTSYMFCYVDAEKYRPSLHAVMEDYWRLMPGYQGVELGELVFRRLLFGFFPTYRDSPLKPGFDRVLQIGDASGIQSPLSFGGFGALTRHIQRLVTSLDEAIRADALDKMSLSLVNAYNPGLSSAWMLQRAMSVRPEEQASPDLINKVLSGNFKAMQDLGNPVIKPFLQDVIKLEPLMKTLTAQVVQEPLFVPVLMRHVGPFALLDWLQHVTALGAFTALHTVASPQLRAVAEQLPPKQRFQLKRLCDAWEYGSGSDYQH